MKHTPNSDKATLDGVTKELAKPRMTKSARAAGLLFDTSPPLQLPNVTVLGIAAQIIRSSSNQAEKPQITGAPKKHRKIR